MAPTPDEKTYVKIPFIEQLKRMGWEHIECDIDVSYLTERESSRDVLLADKLRKMVTLLSVLIRIDSGVWW